MLRRKRDLLRTSQKGILSKHKNLNSLKEFCIFYFLEKTQTSLAFLENKKPTTLLWVSFCGERGIYIAKLLSNNSEIDSRKLVLIR